MQKRNGKAGKNIAVEQENCPLVENKNVIAPPHEFIPDKPCLFLDLSGLFQITINGIYNELIGE